MRKIIAILLMVTLVGSLMAGCVDSKTVTVEDTELPKSRILTEEEARKIGVPLSDIKEIYGDTNDTVEEKYADTGAVVIEDKNLESAIREIIGKSTGEITKKDMEVLVILDIRDKDVSNLKGLEHATNLLYLGIVNKDSSLSDLRPISKLTKLSDLIIENAEISDTSPLKDLTNLTILSLKNNNISDISPLKNLINLDCIDIEYNNVRDIDVFSEFTKLRYAYIEGNNISDINPLSGLTELKRLRVTNNIKDLSMLENLDNLVDLELVQ